MSDNLELLDELLEGQSVKVSELSSNLDDRSFTTVMSGVEQEDSSTNVYSEKIEQESGAIHEAKRKLMPVKHRSKLRSKLWNSIPSLSLLGIERETAAKAEVLSGSAGGLLLPYSPAAGISVTSAGLSMGLRDGIKSVRERRAEELTEEYGEFDLEVYTDESVFTTVYHATDSYDNLESIIQDGTINTSENGFLREIAELSPITYTNQDKSEMEFYLNDDNGAVFEIEVHPARLRNGAHSKPIADPIYMDEVQTLYLEDKSSLQDIEHLVESEDYAFDIQEWRRT